MKHLRALGCPFPLQYSSPVSWHITRDLDPASGPVGRSQAQPQVHTDEKQRHEPKPVVNMFHNYSVHLHVHNRNIHVHVPGSVDSIECQPLAVVL